MSKQALATATRELNDIRQALDQAAIVAVTDRAGQIIHVNDKFCQISKYSREELLGQNHRIINSGHHARGFFIEMWKHISEGKVWEGEIRNRAKDGSYYWVNTTIVPFFNEAGEVYQHVSIRYDITQRKAAEEQLRVYADRLERSNQELQDFASIAAHDLHEPLRKIQSFGDRLLTKHQAQLDGEARDYLDRMLASSKRMRRLIDDLLTYARVTTGAKAFAPTHLDQVLKDVLSDLEVSIEQAQGRVERTPLGTIEADGLQMHQLFQNLVANAVKFHRPGVAPVVKIESRTEGNRCVITVEDNGIGFDEKYLDKIFTIFQRLHGKQEYEGTGVGLAVCRRIVERHGGTLSARSQVGQGATFTISLPIQRSIGPGA